MIRENTLSSKQLREYGFIMGLAVALIFGLYPWLVQKKTLVTWPFVVLATFWAVSIVYPKALIPLYKAWMIMGSVLGRINSSVILSFCFFAFFFPIAVIFRLLKRDRLHRLPEECSTYRIHRSNLQSPHQMENPF